MIFWVRGVWNRKIILRLRCKCNIYIKLAGFDVCYSKFRPHDVLKGTCLWSFHMLVMVTQQDGRKKRTVKRLCVTKVAWLILACCVVIFTWHNCFLVFYEKICLKESETWRKCFSNKILSRGISHNFAFLFFTPSCYIRLLSLSLTPSSGISIPTRKRQVVLGTE